MANLATMIMEGATFSKNGSSIDISGYDFSKQATMESDFTNNAVATLYTDIMEAETAYMAADVIIAAKGVHAQSVNESFEMKPVIEGAIKDFFTKIVDALKKFWAKIVEWFKKVFEWFRMMFSNAKEFAKRYGKELRNKKYEGFKWEGFEWTLSDGDTKCAAWVAALDKSVENLGGKLGTLTSEQASKMNSDYLKNNPGTTNMSEVGHREGDAVTIDKSDSGDNIKQAIATAAGATKWEDGTSTSDLIDEILKKDPIKASDQSEMRSNLEEAYRNGSSEKTTITDFDCGKFKNPGNVIDFLDKGEKQISDFEKDRKKIEKPIQTLIKVIDKIKVDDKETNHAELTSNVSYASSVCTGILNCIKTCFNVKIEAYKAALSELLGVMKRFYSFKTATESMDMYDVESLGVLESVSILEGKDDSDDDDKGSKDDSDDDKDSKGKDDDSKEDEEEASESVKHILEMAHSFSF